MAGGVSNVYDPGDGSPLATRIVNRDGSPISAGGGGGTSSVDDAAFTVGASSITPSGGLVTSDTVDAGDVGAFAMLTNRQQKITLYDSSGVEITSFGGGTQYTEDAASAANPVGGMLILRRRDALSATEVSADSDNIAASSTSKGELYVKHVDSVPVTGTFWQATQPVSGTFWQATQPVSGTVAVTGVATAANQTTEIGHLATLAGAVAGTEVQVDVLTIAAGDNNIGNVDVASSALPTGAATSALQGTGNTSLATVAGAVSGSEMQVDIVSAPTLTVNAHAVTNAGTFAVQAAQSGTWSMRLTDGTDTADVLDLTNANPLTVAIVDGSGDQITSFGGGTQYTEDAVAAANPVGTVPILVRKDTPAASVTTDGDNVAQRGSDYGAAYVTLVDNAGGFVSVGGGTQYDEDTAHVSGDKLTMAGVVRLDAAASLAGTDGDRTALQVDANGALRVTGGGGGTEYTVNAVTPADPTGSTWVMERDDALSALTEAEGDWTQPRANANGALWVKHDGTVVVSGTVTADVGSGTQAVSGTVTANLAAGTNNIGDVDVLTVPVDPFGANADAASATGSISAKLRFIAATGIPITGTVTVGSHAVTNAGTFVVQENGAALTALQLLDDIVYTDDTSTHATGTSKGALLMAAATPTDASVNANDIGALAMTTDRKLHVSVQDALPAGTNNIGDVDVLTVPTDPFGANADAASATGSISAKLRFIAATGIPITGTVTVGSHAVTNAGTFAVQAAAAGDVAHDGGDSGNPVKIGARARSSEIAAVANNDRSDLVTDLVGKLIVLPYANPENFVSGAITTAMTGTTSTSLIASPGAGLRNYITQITVSNAHATVGTDIVIQDGSSGTTFYTIPAAAVYGGATLTFPVPLRQPTAATALFCANVTTGASTKASASGYKGA